VAATLNYRHLRYFWTVARCGSIARACEQLHVTPQSISGQLRELEDALGLQLFRRAGRGLETTEAARRILGYAEQIFALGDELLAAARAGAGADVLAFRVGVADAVPKLLAYRVVEPALRLPQPVHLVCREGGLVPLLADLAVHRLDVVIADRPMPPELRLRAWNHLLGSSDLDIVGTPALCSTLRGGFPALLDGAPFLMPGEGAAVRAALERWFDAQGVHPRTVAEFDDSALLKAFGQAGGGLFAVPSAISDDVCRQYGVAVAGRAAGVTEHLYAITTERRMRNPATLAVSRAALQEVFTDVVPAPVPARARPSPQAPPGSGAGQSPSRSPTPGAAAAPAAVAPLDGGRTQSGDAAVAAAPPRARGRARVARHTR
jgi:LysR family transcriptional activator of nhaA